MYSYSYSITIIQWISVCNLVVSYEVLFTLIVRHPHPCMAWAHFISYSAQSYVLGYYGQYSIHNIILVPGDLILYVTVYNANILCSILFHSYGTVGHWEQCSLSNTSLGGRWYILLPCMAALFKFGGLYGPCHSPSLSLLCQQLQIRDWSTWQSYILGCN